MERQTSNLSNREIGAEEDHNSFTLVNRGRKGKRKFCVTILHLNLLIVCGKGHFQKVLGIYLIHGQNYRFISSMVMTLYDRAYMKSWVTYLGSGTNGNERKKHGD